MLNNVFYLYFYTDKFDKLVARQPYYNNAFFKDKSTLMINDYYYI